MTLLEKFDHAVQLTMDDWKPESFWKHFSEGGYDLAVIVKKTHVFLVGDLILVSFCNGSGCRWPVYGRSSRGYSVSGYYMGFFKNRSGSARWSEKHKEPIFPWERYTNRVSARFVEIPSEVRTLSATDSGAIRRWLSTTQLAGDPVSDVGQGSVASLSLVQDTDLPPRRKRSSTVGLRERRLWKKWRA